jgi:hypothetical protein
LAAGEICRADFQYPLTRIFPRTCAYTPRISISIDQSDLLAIKVDGTESTKLILMRKSNGKLFLKGQWQD